MRIIASGLITSWQIMGKNGNIVRLYFLGLQNHCGQWLQPWNQKHLLFGVKVMTNLDSILKSRDITDNKGLYSQSYGFSSTHVQLLDHKEDWALRNWCFWKVVLEKTLESPLDCKIKPANPKGNQCWIFIWRTDAKAGAPKLWPSDVKSWLIGKDSYDGKDWRQKEKGEEEYKMVR